jgi:hypothetical protein
MDQRFIENLRDEGAYLAPTWKKLGLSALGEQVATF